MERGLLDIRTGEPFTARDRLNHREEIGLVGAASATSPRSRSLITARGMTMGGKKLPYDYEVEYIATIVKGYQYIDTGYNVVDGDVIMVELSVDQSIGDSTAYIAGSDYAYRAGFNVNYAYNIANNDYLLRSTYGGSVADNRKIADYVDSKQVIGVRRSVVSYPDRAVIDGVSINRALVTPVSGTGSVLLFTTRRNGSPFLAYGLIGKVYLFAVYRNGREVIDLIPVVKDGEGMMYDKVSGNFFRNAGTGAFVVGPRI